MPACSARIVDAELQEPAQQERSLKAASRAARDDLEQVRQVDLSRVGDRNRDPVRVGTLLRSRARLRKAPKRHFVDPSLALAATGACWLKAWWTTPPPT